MPLPEPHAFCNDIAVDAGGAVYVTDSANPSVLRLPAGASKFEVFATNPQFAPPQPNSAGLDGIAFGGDGAPYVTTYAAGGFFRIAVEKGRAGRVIKLQGRALGLPDGLRPLGRNSFLLVEGAGGKLSGSGRADERLARPACEGRPSRTVRHSVTLPTDQIQECAAGRAQACHVVPARIGVLGRRA